MGRFAVAGFDVGGCRHEIVVSAAPGSDLDRVARDLKPVCARQIALFDPARRRAPMRRYLFLVMATADGYGGLEHRSSTALICGRDDLPYPGMVAPHDGYRTFLGLASHEYFHAWNVKRIKPAVFDPYEWLQETHTDLLWIFEGFTSYYDDLMLRRAGLIDDKVYLSLVERTINRVAAGPGRLVQSVAESSFDAWTKYYRQDENSANSIVSYYLKGSLVALCLDLTIRTRTRSRRSLDDVMRSMWQRWGRDFYGARQTTGHGLAEDGFADVVSESTGLDLRAEIATWAYGTGELPLAETLRPFGVRLEPAPGSGGAAIGARGRCPRRRRCHLLGGPQRGRGARRAVGRRSDRRDRWGALHRPADEDGARPAQARHRAPGPCLPPGRAGRNHGHAAGAATGDAAGARRPIRGPPPLAREPGLPRDARGVEPARAAPARSRRHGPIRPVPDPSVPPIAPAAQAISAASARPGPPLA